MQGDFHRTGKGIAVSKHVKVRISVWRPGDRELGPLYAAEWHKIDSDATSSRGSRREVT